MKSYGADVSVCDYDRRTPLHVAASEGDVAMVKYLMQVNKFTPFLKQYFVRKVSLNGSINHAKETPY